MVMTAVTTTVATITAMTMTGMTMTDTAGMNLAANPIGYGMLTLHCIIGVGAAIAAQRQGRSYGVWLAWGLIGGTVALMYVLFTSPPAKA